MSRICERLIIDGEAQDPPPNHTRVTGYWVKHLFCELQHGDIFRLWDAPGTPEAITPVGQHTVYIALCDAHTEGNDWGVEMTQVRGIVPRRRLASSL